MATPAEIRELALRILYEIDAGGPDAAGDYEGNPAELTETPDRFSAAEYQKAVRMARAAYAGRTETDARVEKLAPTWPASRQPAVDRSLLRLAVHELRSGVSRKVVINEAVELAKNYSTDRSPGFINAVLDKIADQLAGAQPTKGEGPFGDATHHPIEEPSGDSAWPS